MVGDHLHDRVREKLGSIDTSYDESRASLPSFGPFYRQAAVLTSFSLEELKKAGPEEEDDELYSVLADSSYAGPVGKWTLDENVRREVFKEFGRPEEVLEVLDKLESAPFHPAQRMLETYLRREAPPLDRQTLQELTGTYQISHWLSEAVISQIDFPARQEIQSHIERLDLLQPFQWLAGSHFSGRASELKTLNDYVGVLEASDLSQSISRGVREIFSLYKEPPLVIHGPGGIGKSTLIARFILNHVEVAEEHRFPFVYIDFDRPGLLPDQPATLLLEAVRQLSIQHPEIRDDGDLLREEWHQRLQWAVAEKVSPLRTVYSFAEDMRRLLASMAYTDRPLLFVLDTFEEVQFRGDGFVTEVGEFLNVLQESWPRLRTVISGRAPVQTFPFKTRELHLGDLDEEAARGFLQGHGVEPGDTARRIARQIGGNPLTLRLAIEVLRLEKSSELKGIDTRKYFFVRLQSHQVQGQLYRRILWHIGKKNNELRKLAHPGLVLRRITADLIRNVLAEPCKLSLDGDPEATRLFDSMRREVSLLEPDAEGGLRHRPDVRRVMLRLLEADEPDTVREIHRRAIAYYEERQKSSSDERLLRMYRTEELYHRLALRQDTTALDARWLPGIERDLAGAMDEFDAREQAYLASRLGLTISQSVRAMADLQTWERSTETAVTSLLYLNRYEEALKELESRRDRSANSRLHLLDITVRERLNQWTAAAGDADRAITAAADTGDVKLIFELLLARARIASVLQDSDTVRKCLDEAVMLADTAADDFLRFRAGLARVEFAPTTSNQSVLDLAKQFLSLPEDTLRRAPVDVVKAAALLGSFRIAPAAAEDVAASLDVPRAAVLSRAVRLVGIHDATGRQRRALARALVAWDELISVNADEPKGHLARMAGLGFESSYTEAWRRLMESASAGELNDVVSRLLDRADVPSEVRTAVTEIFIGRTRIESDGPGAAPPSSAAPAVLRLDPSQAERLRDAVVKSFTWQELAEVVNARLSRSLRSASRSKSYEAVVHDFIQEAQTTGWLDALVTSLLDARPGAPALQAFAQGTGLASVELDDEKLKRLIADSGSVLGPDEWRGKIGELEAQICRVEVGNDVGTGFLVGPDQLLTSSRTIEAILRGDIDPRNTRILFDYRAIGSGARQVVVSRGTEYSPASDWLFHTDEAVAVLNIDGSPGDQPIGRAASSFEPLARTRGWIRAPLRRLWLEGEKSVFVLCYADHSMSLEYSTVPELAAMDQAGRIRYRLALKPGATGAPCFNANWELIGLHIQYHQKGGYCEGIASDHIAGNAFGRFNEAAYL